MIIFTILYSTHFPHLYIYNTDNFKVIINSTSKGVGVYGTPQTYTYNKQQNTDLTESSAITITWHASNMVDKLNTF